MRYCKLSTTNDAAESGAGADVRQQLAVALGELDLLGPDPAIEHLRNSPPSEDADGCPRWPEPPPEAPSPATRAGSKKHPGIQFPHQKGNRNRPSHTEVEDRIAWLQLWISQRQSRHFIREKCFEMWGMSSSCTLRKYLRVARSRMTEELVSDRSMHIAEQIYALMDVARRAADAEQFSASVGAHRVICEIAGILRAPIKPPSEAR